jgi:hypothetical protein
MGEVLNLAIDTGLRQRGADHVAHDRDALSALT